MTVPSGYLCNSIIVLSGGDRWSPEGPRHAAERRGGPGTGNAAESGAALHHAGQRLAAAQAVPYPGEES